MGRTKKEKKDSPFWNHNVNPVHEGVYKGFQETDKGYAIIVGDKLVGFSSGIRKALLDKVENFVAGKTKLRFQFVEQRKTKGGNKFNVIDVWVNAKQIDTSSFPTLSATEMLLKMKKDEDAPEPKKGRRKK